MAANLRVFSFKCKDNDKDIERHAVQQMTNVGFRTIVIKIDADFKNAVFDKKTDATTFMKLLKKL